MSTLEPEFVSPALQIHPSHRLAVFIDIENFAGYCADMGVPVDIAPVLDHLSKHHGRVQIKRSFGDVSSLPAPAFSPYRIRRMLQAHQIDHLDIPHRPTSYSKNSADIRLVVEAVALIHQRPEITHIVVVSNDRDFIPLFNHAREHGKVVIGCGPRRANVNEDYRHACDVFLFHEDWVTAAAVSAPITLPASAPAAVVAADPPAASPDTSPAPSTPSPALPGVAAGYFAPRAAPELSEQPRGGPPEDPTTASAADLDPVECLLAALRSLQGEGGAMVASRVALRLKALFPGLDVKQAFGSFKQFCIEQAKSGRIVLHNLTLPNFTIAIQDGATTDTPLAEAAAPAPLLAKYQDWSYQKLKIPFPSPAVRTRLYDILVQVLDDGLDRADFISLQEVSRLCSIPLSAFTAQAGDVAFRLCYGLFRGKAFRFYKTENSFNPDIIGLAVDPSQLDECFTHNTRTSFIHDRHYHGLPLDEEVLAKLMQGQASTLTEPADAQPEHAPHSEPAPETETETETEADAQEAVPMPAALTVPEPETLTAAPSSPEPEPEPEPESEPEPNTQGKAGQSEAAPAQDPAADVLIEQPARVSVSAAVPESEPEAPPKPKRSTARKKTTPAAAPNGDTGD
jgi:hypothetical protein